MSLESLANEAVIYQNNMEGVATRMFPNGPLHPYAPGLLTLDHEQLEYSQFGPLEPINTDHVFQGRLVDPDYLPDPFYPLSPIGTGDGEIIIESPELRASSSNRTQGNSSSLLDDLRNYQFENEEDLEQDNYDEDGSVGQEVDYSDDRNLNDEATGSQSFDADNDGESDSADGGPICRPGRGGKTKPEPEPVSTRQQRQQRARNESEESDLHSASPEPKKAKRQRARSESEESDWYSTTPKLKKAKRQRAHSESEESDLDSAPPPSKKAKREIKTSKDAKPKEGKWSDAEHDAVHQLLRAQRAREAADGSNPLRDDNLWTGISVALSNMGFNRTKNACRMYWNRYGRSQSGYDERVTKTGSLVTSSQNKKKSKAATTKTETKESQTPAKMGGKGPRKAPPTQSTSTGSTKIS